MSLVTLSNEEAQKHEAEFDSLVETMPLPSQEHAQSKYYLLAMSEVLARAIPRSAFASSVIQNIEGAHAESIKLFDDLKYALKYGLAMIYKRQPFNSISQGKLEFSRRRVERTTSLLRTLTDYDDVVRAFTYFHSGRANLNLETTSGRLVVEPSNEDIVDSVVDVLMANTNPEGAKFIELILWMVDPFFTPEISKLAKQFHRKDSSESKNTFNVLLAKEIKRNLQPRRINFLSDWNFKWGTPSQISQFLECLQLRVFYHLIQNDAKFQDYRNKGASDWNLCMLIERRTLADELRELSDLPEEMIHDLINVLTYGNGVKTPDPALQPLIPASPNTLFLPSMLILTSNHSRNFLSLQARVDPKSFDRSSHVFEKKMVTELEPNVKQKYPFHRFNSHIPEARDAGEVDLILADPQSKTILICEMRWIHQAGDAREVENKHREVEAKIPQVQRKMESAKRQRKELLQSLGITICDDTDHHEIETDWQVFGCVILEGHYKRRERERIAIVPKQVFLIGLNSIEGLHKFCLWMLSESWMPQRGIHFLIHEKVVRIRTKQISFPGIEVTNIPHTYLEHIQLNAKSVY